MPSEHPQLFIIGGSDDGRVIVLDYLPATLGRDANCAIRMRDPYISREHMVFHTGDEGVLCEVLSKRRVEIDGKKYKRGKRVVLDTGDVLELGHQTEAFFVAAGDDGAEALAARRAARPVPLVAEPAPEPPPPEPAPEPEAPEPDDFGVPFADAAPASTAAEPMTVGDIEAVQRQKRMRKIVIALGIYIALIVGAGVVLYLFKAPPKTNSDARPTVLGKREIEAILRAEPELSADREMAKTELDAARQEYEWRGTRPGAYYQCVDHYKRAKVYGRRTALGIEDSQKFTEVMTALFQKVLPLYGEACRDSQQRLWNDADAKFKRLRALVPDADNKLYKNILRHQSYIDRMKDRKKKKGRGFLQK